MLVRHQYFIKSTIISISQMFEKSKRKGEKSHVVRSKERGQGLVEYALILVLVAIVVIAVLMVLGPVIGNVFSSINKSLSSV